ncbi:hypothetical protein CLS_37870 [[Clostridium] cf. saccharolyticum K10]|nr:hypothetical protein CLS_37870 [[Clostridium] cf. saccharolyticum K10]
MTGAEPAGAKAQAGSACSDEWKKTVCAGFLQR